MKGRSLPIQKADFGEFEIDFVTGRLLRNGATLNVPVQPLQILIMLLERPGELVPREELQAKLWADTFVDKEHSLNAAVKRLRGLLEDDAENPRFIETIARRGYRFIGLAKIVREPLGEPSPDAAAAEPAVTSHSEVVSQPSVISRPIRPWRRRWLWPAVAIVALLASAGISRRPVARWSNNRGADLQQQGDLAGAIRHYERALAIYPNYPEAHYNLADAYEELSRYDNAMAQYERAIELDDKFYEAYNNLARLYILRRNDPGAALVLLDRALNHRPGAISVRYSLYKNRGWANFQLRYFMQAERDIRMAMTLGMKHAAAHCLLARTLEARGEYTQAIPEWEACVADAAPGEKDTDPSWLHLAQERLQQNENGRSKQ